MKNNPLSIVIVGHMDHGKSTLIGRLLLETNSLPVEKIQELKKISRDLGKETEIAYLTDQLKEERENNLTIDTTQIFFKTKKRKYVIIDAPGHLEFIQNMLSGATLAQAAILVVDIQEGIQEQTKRHAYLIHMLGLQNIIVVANKMDLVGYAQAPFEAMKQELLTFFSKMELNPAFFIPISARCAENISTPSASLSWYKGPVLLSALDSLQSEESDLENVFRFPIQDIYTQEDKKILVGRITIGSVRKGEKLLLLPEREEVMVKEILIFGKHPKKAGAHENVGLVLAENLPCRRGQILTQKKNPPPLRSTFRSHVFWLSEKPLANQAILSLRSSTQETSVRVQKIEERIDSSSLTVLEKDASCLQKNETGIVLFEALSPLVLEKFCDIPELGRFVIEEKEKIEGTGIVVEEKIA